MKKFDEWFFPDSETQLPAIMEKMDVRCEGRLTWQKHKYDAALSLCKERRTAVDVGAHVGLFSYWMAKDFKFVHAFEPSSENRACWKKNVTIKTARIHAAALGNQRGHVKIVQPSGKSGGTFVADVLAWKAPELVVIDKQKLATLDSFKFATVDLLKIDCEGYEPAVIEGAKETIIRCRPVVLVEQYPDGGQSRYGYAPTAAVDLLLSYGASIRTQLGYDYILEFV